MNKCKCSIEVLTDSTTQIKNRTVQSSELPVANAQILGKTAVRIKASSIHTGMYAGAFLQNIVTSTFHLPPGRHGSAAGLASLSLGAAVDGLLSPPLGPPSPSSLSASGNPRLQLEAPPSRPPPVLSVALSRAIFSSAASSRARCISDCNNHDVRYMTRRKELQRD